MRTLHPPRVVISSVSAALVVLVSVLGGAGWSGAAPAPAPPLPVPAPPSHPTPGFSVFPYAEPGAPARSDFNFDVDAGQTITDRLVITNPTTGPKPFYVYVAGVFNTLIGGALAVGQRTDRQTDAAAWISLPGVRGGQVTVPAQSAAELSVVFQIPTDASPGDHDAAVMAEEILPAVKPAHGAGFVTVHRVGTRAVLRVSGPLHAGLAVTQLSVTHQDPVIPLVTGRGRSTLTFTVVNTGNVGLRLDKLTLSEDGLFGRSIHRYVLSRSTPTTATVGLPDQLLPGGKVQFAKTFAGLPPLELLTARATVNGSDATVSSPVSTSSSRSFWVLPWLVLAVAALVLVGWALRRRWRRSGPGAGPHGGTFGGPGAPDLAAGAPVLR